MFKFTHYVMCLAPIGIFAMIAFTVGKFGLGMLIPLMKLIGSLYFAGSVPLLGLPDGDDHLPDQFLPVAAGY